MSGLFSLLTGISTYSQLIPRKTAPLYITIDQLKSWTTSGSTASNANVSTIVLAPRQNILNSQLNPNMSFDMKINWCPDGMDIWSNYLSEQPKFNLYNFTHWHYCDVLTWFCNAADGVFIPAKPWIDAAHRNGVTIIGTVFFGTQSAQVSRLLEKDSEGKYGAVKKLIDIANYYHFDGWFINQEVSVSSAVAADMIAFLKQLQSTKPEGMEIHWYDAMLPSGSVSYQNTYNASNKQLMQDGTTRVSDGFFTNYNWGTSHVTNAVTTAKSVNRSSFDIYMGCDVWPGRPAQHLFDNTTWMELLFTNNNLTLPKTSAAIFAANITWNGGFHSFATNGADYANFYKTEVRVFSGDDLDITTVDAAGKWKGLGYYLPVRCIILSLPFETSFNVGQGKIFAINGSQVEKNWTDIGKQGILPSWQWAKTGAGTISVGYDFDQAYNGGTSLKIGGSLNSTSATIKLFQTKLVISSVTKFDFIFKAGQTGATHLQVLLYFSDDLNAPVSLDLNDATNTSWNKHTFDLSSYAGKELAILGIKVASSESVSTYAINVGSVKMYNDVTAIVKNDRITSSPRFSIVLTNRILSLSVSDEETYDLVVSDLQGRQLFKKILHGTKTSFSEIMIPHGGGLYIVSIIKGKRLFSRKMIIY
jgi:endo-beta-N-acetylglucosaminidase D